MISIMKRVLVCTLIVLGCTGEKPTEPVAVASVTIASHKTTLMYAEELQLTATISGSNGTSLSGRPVLWSSTNEDVASVSSTGLVTAGPVRGGTSESVIITATSEGKSATITLVVTPIPVATLTPSTAHITITIGQFAQLTITSKDETGTVVTGRTATWSSSHPNIATVSSQGVVTALTPGRTTITTTVEGKSASISATISPITLTVNIAGGGAAQLVTRSTGLRQTLASSSAITIDNLQDTIEIIPQSNETVIFDRITGAIQDTLQLLPSYKISPQHSTTVTVGFVQRKKGSKQIQNSYGDANNLQYRTGDNFVVWWDARWDDNYYARYVLNWAEYAWKRTVDAGMQPPSGHEQTYINIYIHHITAHGGPKDGFDDAWGQGVGTNEYGMPFYVAPGNPQRITLQPTYSCCGILHEAFHIMQYRSSRTGTFPYSDDSGWFTEATAVWFDRHQLEIVGDKTNDYGNWNTTPFLFMQPQQAMWASIFDNGGTQASFSRGIRKYEMGFLLNYLVWRGIIDETFVYRAYASGTSLLPQEYLNRNIPDFKGAFRRFATRMTVLDELPTWARSGIRYMQDFYTRNPQWPPANQNLRADGTFDDNTYVLSLRDRGTDGFFSPSEQLEPWSYSVSRLDALQAGSYIITIAGNDRGSEGTPADLYVGTVLDHGGTYTYGTIALNSFTGTQAIDVPSNSTLYVVVVSTPQTFSGRERFEYRIKIDRTR